MDKLNPVWREEHRKNQSWKKHWVRKTLKGEETERQSFTYKFDDAKGVRKQLKAIYYGYSSCQPNSLCVKVPIVMRGGATSIVVDTCQNVSANTLCT